MRNSGNSTPTDLADVIAGIRNSLHETLDGAKEEIDRLVHNYAVGLLNASLPPMVHGHNALVRSGAWMRVQALTAQLSVSLGGATVSNGVLAGKVAGKVSEGVAHITSDLDYAHGVNSIT